MYYIRSKRVPEGGRKAIGIADHAGYRYFFEDTRTPHEITEQQLANLKMTYGNELENYISIEKVGGEPRKISKKQEEPKPAVRTEMSEIIDRDEPKPEESKEENTVEDKPMEDLSYREIYEEIRQMTLEEVEKLHELELQREEPRKSVIQEIERAKKRLNA